MHVSVCVTLFVQAQCILKLECHEIHSLPLKLTHMIGIRMNLMIFLPLNQSYKPHQFESVYWTVQDAVSYTHLDVYKRQPYVLLVL